MSPRVADLWGSARGPLKRLSPLTRALVGLTMLAACLLAPMPSTAAVPVVLTALAWVGAARLPRRVLGAALAVACVSVGPYALLALGFDDGAVAVRIAVRGTACLLVSIATAASLTMPELHVVAARLLPQPVAAILMQVVHQTATLAGETMRIVAAVRMRAAAGDTRAAWLVLASLPRVWLPRVLLRAERVAMAMELRGFHGGAPSPGPTRLRGIDGLVLAGSTAVLAVSVVLRGLAA